MTQRDTGGNKEREQWVPLTGCMLLVSLLLCGGVDGAIRLRMNDGAPTTNDGDDAGADSLPACLPACIANDDDGNDGTDGGIRLSRR